MPLRPEVYNIPYDSDLHRRCLAAIKQRYQMSYDYMSRKYKDWSYAEERAKAYVNVKEADATRKELRKQGSPQYVTLDVPYSYALLLASHTYWSSIFLSRNPILQYQGTSGQTQTAEQAVEALMNYQVAVAEMQTRMSIWLMDVGKYGLGVVYNSWVDEAVYTSKVIAQPAMYYGIPVPFAKPRYTRQTVKIPTYEGNRLYNVRPQDWFPDPRVPINRFQQGEFCGHRLEIGWNTVLKRQQEGWYFNVTPLQDRIRATRGDFRDLGSSQMNLPASMDAFYYRSALDDGSNPDKKKAFIDVKCMTIEIVPRDWGLGNSPYPEKWVFEYGNDEVIICAMPQGRYHGKYEYAPIEYEIEGYEQVKRGMLEILDPLNETLTWLFNSHMYNVRKMVNDQLVIDPSRVTMKDITDPASGRVIRLKPDAYGTDPALTVHQLEVQDVTQNHLRDAEVVMGIMQRVVGANDNIMGVVNEGGRKTATEVRTSTGLGINRLKTNSEFYSCSGFAPLGRLMLQNTQQYYDQQRMFRVAGDAMGVQSLMVTPADIAGEFDYVAVDGTLPVDRFAMANLWKEMLPIISGIPPIAMSTDWPKLMQYIAQLGGLKNFNGFRLNVMSDQAMAASVQAGNSVPLSEVANGKGTQSGSGSPARLTAVPGPASVAGVGRTG